MEIIGLFEVASDLGFVGLPNELDGLFVFRVVQ
jgi:hypothetical protein